MAETNVTQWNSEDHAVEAVDWEEQSYLEGCDYAREQARLRLKALDDELLDCKPKGLRVEGFRERTLVTRFGEVVARRRMYSDGKTSGPHNSRPWTHSLRRLVKPRHRLN